MKVQPIKVDKIVAGQASLTSVIDEFVSEITENSVLAITSKIVSLCEGSVVPASDTDKQDIIKQESSYYLPRTSEKYSHQFTITNNTLIASAGIDQSNSGGLYVLWPKDPVKTANQVRLYLSKRFGLKNVGVIITDSTSQPLRRGTIGIVLGYSGFNPLKTYVGKPDLFGRPFGSSKASIAGGLASSAVLVMGEGSEQTPMALISDLDFVEFAENDPSPEELKEYFVEKDEDIFDVILKHADWEKGDKA